MGLFDTLLGKQLAALTARLTTSAAAARATWRVSTQQPAPSRVALEAQAQALVGRIMRTGLAARSAPLSPREKNLGAWRPFEALHTQDRNTQAALRSRDARYARTTSGAGIEPTAFAPYPELTLPVIAEAQRRAHRTGWVDRKADIDERYRRDDSHIKAVDRKLRAWAFKAPLRVRPRSDRPLSILVAAAVRAALDQLDGFQSSVGELGVVACAGFSAAELLWRDATLSVPLGPGKSLRLPSEIVGSLEAVGPRYFAFDIVDDSPWLCMGAGSYVDVAEPGLQKFMFVKGDGDGPTRFRGYGWAASWLGYLSNLTLEKFGVVVEVFGLAVPYLQREADGYLTDEEHQHAVAILERLGTGQPEIIPSRYGELKHSPVPAGLAPIHAQMLGYCKSELSKLVLGSTLAVEIGSNGSYAAANVHADGLVDTQRIYASLIAEALRSQVVRWLLEANAARWATAFSRYVSGGCRPDDIVAELPLVEWVLTDETPAQRLAVFQGAKGLGIEIDPEQVREELGVRAPIAPFACEPQPDPLPLLVPQTPDQSEPAPAPATEIP